MPIAPDRLDKFTFMAGQGHFNDDPEVIKRNCKLIGVEPPTPEEQAYIAKQWEKRFDVEDDLSTDKLRAEYARKKALGEL